MEVKIISTEMIEPASPTPPHLRYFNLCSLDQLCPYMFVPLILYYPHHQMGRATPSTADISRCLKSSLSQTLVQFYPLAGRLVGEENQIECNDQGVEFYETRVLHCRLEKLLMEPNQISFPELLPCDHNCAKSSGREDALMAVQANFFDCGGLALGVSISHSICDAASFTTFLNSWASTAGEGRSTPSVKTPFVIHHHLFPQIPGLQRPGYKVDGNIRMKRFVIDAVSLATLRQKRGGAPTRVEVVTALVSRCAARATKQVTNADVRDEGGFVVFHSVNLRRRMEPPLPDDAFGNFWVFVVSPVKDSPTDDGDGDLEVQLRGSFKSVDAAFVKQLQGPHGCQMAMEAAMVELKKNQGKETPVFVFSSWCRYGYYEVDFGWGKPQWVTPAPMPMKNVFLLIDQKEEDGVEVWATMSAEDMAKFEQDQELLSYVSPPQIQLSMS